jgi:CheY-like chemotaxis protein
MLISIVDDDDHFCESVQKWIASFVKNHPTKQIELHVHKNCILLDLDFDGRKTAGVDALVHIRRSRKKTIRKIPVVIYSNSDDPSEIDNCYLKFANSYVWKGNGFNDQKHRFLEIVHYWIDTASLPPCCISTFAS